MAHCGHMVLVGLMTLIFVFYCEEVTGVDVRANPSTITIGGQNSENSRLTISCTPDAPGITAVFAIEIGKKTQFNTNSPIVQITAGNPDVDIKDTSLQQRMTQTGSINAASGNLEIVLSDLRCTDAASYYCTSSYNAATIDSDEGIVNVTARTFPEEVTMFPSPDFSQYDPNTQLELTCNGRIGNQFDPNNMANVWVWEWRFVDGFNSQWTTYPNTNNNITFDPPTTAANCQYNARSVLKHVVKSTDNGRQFRCYVVSPEYGGNKTVYTETPPIAGSPLRTGDGTEVNGANLQATPSTITIGGENSANSKLTVSCSPSATGITTLYAIEIGKKSQTNTNLAIVQMTNGQPGVVVKDPSLVQRMTHSGSINGGSGNLEIVLSDLRCTDAASYYCTTGFNTGNIDNNEATVNVTARTFPEEVTMFPSPDFSQYDPNTQLELTCNGRIGNQFDPNNMANVWVWEWRFVDEFNSQWTTYPNTNNNITFDPPTTAANCQYNARSVLKHMVKSTDNGRQFRCYVVSPEYGGNKTVYTETPPIVGTEGSNWFESRTL